LKPQFHTYKPFITRVLPGVLLFLISFLWFYFPGEYVLIANRDLALFHFSPEALASILDQPGGLLEYAGNFLNQFLRFRFAGALVLAIVITTGYFIMMGLAALIFHKKDIYIPGILTSVLLLGMHNYYPHQIAHSLGFILAIALLISLHTLKKRKFLFLALAVPIFYLVAGGFVWMFSLLVIVLELAGGRKAGILSLLLVSLYPAFLVAACAALVYLDPFKELALRPLPFGADYGLSPWPGIFVAWLIICMVLVQLPIRIPGLKALWMHIIQGTAGLLAMVLVLHFSYNRKNGEFFQIEQMAVEQEWDKLLEYTTEHPSRNLFGSFYTNLALANTGQLCSGLFQYPQSFGRRGLCFNWEAKSEILRRGSDFFWTVHFVNEAHHWAFESMIVDGFTRRNLSRLIQAELVRGNYKVAEKYIDLLGSAMFQKNLANHYAVFLNDPGAMESDPELGPRLKTHMKKDFFSEGMDLEINLRSLLANEPMNLRAYDYLIALLLLEKEVNQVREALPAYLRASGGKLPALLDECLLVYQITHPEEDISPLKVSAAAIQRFEAYTRVLREYRDQNTAARVLHPSYGNSFWFYLNFVSLPNQQQ